MKFTNEVILTRSISDPTLRVLAAMLRNAIETFGWLQAHGHWEVSPKEMPLFATPDRLARNDREETCLSGCSTSSEAGLFTVGNPPTPQDVYTEARAWRSGSIENLCVICFELAGIKCGEGEFVKAALEFSKEIKHKDIMSGAKKKRNGS